MVRIKEVYVKRRFAYYMRIKGEQKTGPDWSRRKFTGKMAGRLYLGFKCPRILIQLILIQLILLLFPNKLLKFLLYFMSLHLHNLLKKGSFIFILLEYFQKKEFLNILLFRVLSWFHNHKANKVYVTLCTQLFNRNLTDTGYWISFGYQLNELLVGQGEGHHFPAFPSMQLIKLIRHPLVI